MHKVTIYGERCSGTTYLEELLITNFDVEIVWDYGWKHFFGFNDLSNSDNVLFIGIVRNIRDWISSLYKTPHHLPKSLKKDIFCFLNNEFYSQHDNGKENMCDRNIETKKRYKNIFELRHIKNKFLVESMPKLVKNYLLITYDMLISNFEHVMNQIKNCNLNVKNNIHFPLNVNYYKKDKKELFIKNNNRKICKKIIIKKANTFYEKILFPDDYKNKDNLNVEKENENKVIV